MTAAAMASSGSREITAIIAGASGGFIVGFNRGSIGATYPIDAVFRGKPVVVLEDQVPGNALIVQIDGAGEVLTKPFFTSIAINGTTYLTSASNFNSVGGGLYQWDWTPKSNLVDGTLYTVTIA